MRKIAYAKAISPNSSSSSNNNNNNNNNNNHVIALSLPTKRR